MESLVCDVWDSLFQRKYIESAIVFKLLSPKLILEISRLSNPVERTKNYSFADVIYEEHEQQVRTFFNGQEISDWNDLKVEKKGLSHTIGSPSIISSLLTLIVKIKLSKTTNGKFPTKNSQIFTIKKT